LCIVWKAENDIQILDWSDANLIENVWFITKKKLQGKRVFTLKQLCRHVELSDGRYRNNIRKIL